MNVMSNAVAESEHARTLRALERLCVVGVVASVVLLGHVASTRALFYAVMAVSLAGYLVLRGEGMLDAVLRYLASHAMLLRWAFLLWAVLSLLWSVRGGTTVTRVVTLLEIHVVGAVLFDFARRDDGMRWILGVVFVSVAVGVAHALATASPTGAVRLTGVFGNPNLLAVTCLVSLSAFFSGAVAPSGRWLRFAAHVAALVILLGLLATSSLKGLVGAAFVFAAFLFARSSRRRTAVQLAAAALVGAGAVGFVAAFRTYLARTVYRFSATAVSLASEASLGNSIVQRLSYYRDGAVLVSDAPIRGWGLDSFRWLAGEGRYAHSNVVEIGVALGLVGLLLYYGFYAALFIGALSRRDNEAETRVFFLVFVPLMAVMDLALVSYALKLPALLMIAGAGWLECRRGVEVAHV